MTHDFWMTEAIRLARFGAGRVNPNPMVGAVIVKHDRVIGRGYHHAFGEAHAEREALRNCTESPRGAALYVNLEPCCHHGKTPPCTDAMIESGISSVVIGALDPNPAVSGGGVAALRTAGISVTTGILQAECERLNAVFFHFISGNTPYVVMKYAMTADGKIATVSGAAKWITGDMARAHVHETRNALAGILVGIGTVLSDDPLLTCRLPNGRNPLRIVCDSRLQTPLDSRLVKTAKDVPTLIACCRADAGRAQALAEHGCRVLELPHPSGRVDLRALMETLHSEGVDSVLLEGGADLNFAMLQAELVQRLHIYLAPKIFGGVRAKSPVGGIGITLPQDALRLSAPEITALGDDLLLEYDVLKGGG